MKIKTNIWLTYCTNALIILWGYTSLWKLAEFDKFKHELYLQFSNREFSEIFVYLLPAVELFLVVLLLIEATKKIGLVFSVALLTIFTIYIVLILSHFFRSTPCICGGVLELLGWKSHFFFNLFFLSLNIIAIKILNKTRKEVTGA
ncbi:hypothetical protein GJU39_01310 [Pedobacter petrophilus]|uniref:Methylamine utilisation protein MauE domain-containing protein n=1 Tax=Pedobacter petrophilus TaxID=1908241 RepID=A0A7K0FTQ9_9SPHI|nr:MauE/DoxX family redox-associated membrane protein [Pedobacter petrophilus]MRX74712.1 hypothetical protein [Pedobacter petrophilus]